MILYKCSWTRVDFHRLPGFWKLYCQVKPKITHKCFIRTQSRTRFVFFSVRDFWIVLLGDFRNQFGTVNYRTKTSENTCMKHWHKQTHTHLQWTTMGPASGGLQALTLRRKARKGVGCSGTPWSGQAVNWKWRTSRFSLEPLWTCSQTRVLKVLNT